MVLCIRLDINTGSPLLLVGINFNVLINSTLYVLIGLFVSFSICCSVT